MEEGQQEVAASVETASEGGMTPAPAPADGLTNSSSPEADESASVQEGAASETVSA